MYNTYGNIVNDRSSGGSTILVRQGIIHSRISLNTSLQATAVRLTLHKTVSICSLYIPPNYQITRNDLNELYNQLPSPRMILGDFNGHHPLWGSNNISNRGKIIEDFINTNDLCIFNNGSFTYLHPGHGTYTAIDLSLVEPTLFLDFEWTVLEDTHGSDHFPIILKCTKNSNSNTRPRWNLNKADWSLFTELCLKNITESKYENLEQPMETFTNDLIEIANKAIPKTGTNLKHSPKPWFDKDVKEAINKRKRALRKFKLQPTNQNLNVFKILRAQARKLIRQKKRDSWRVYISKLNERTPSSKVWQMIKKIQGKDMSSHLQYLVVNDEEFITPESISNKLGEQFAFNSSSENYSPEFRQFKNKEEKLTLNIQSNNSENYNRTRSSPLSIIKTSSYSM